MDKRFLAVVGAIIIIFVGFLVVRGGDKAEAPKTSAKPSSHTRGEGASGVTLVEYGDFQCPACKQYYPIIEEVVNKHAADITFQFRNFPLTSIHPNAFAASRAAEAASKQGNFWEMYDKLYGGQDDWSRVSSPNKIFETYATQLELDMEKYRSDFKSTAVNDTINADLAAGGKLDITGTPGFVLDGKLIKNPNSVDEFSKLIEDAIAKKKQKND